MMALIATGFGSLALLTYSAFAADRDAYAFLQYFSTLFPGFKFATRALFLLLYLTASLKHIRTARNLDHRINTLVAFTQILSFYIFIISLSKGHNLSEALSFVVYSGTPVLVIWIAYAKPTNHLHSFRLFVLFQLILAASVLSIPSLSPLDGATYKAEEGVYIPPSNGLNYRLPFGSADKGTIGRYAQFHNPNALGFYSTVAIALALAIFLSSRSIGSITLSGSLLILGTLGWLNSMTRGPIALLFVGVLLYLLTRPRRPLTTERTIKRLFTTLLLLGSLILVLLTLGLPAYFFPDASSSSVSSRMVGYTEGLNAIAAHPITGVPRNWQWESADPHLIFLAFSADFGIIGGALITFIVFGGGVLIVANAAKRLRKGIGTSHNNALAIFLVFVTWGVAMTNNLTAPVLFWLCFSQAALLSLSPSEQSTRRLAPQ